jgi:LysR family transcriptional regulator, benzoate and cis,cis-muconate-responsive activator of ben and cat genes
VELRHLRYFVAVAEMENVSKAALKLHVSQPALSRQIRDLEDEIGVALFERTAKSVSLTEPGRVFFKEAREVLLHADDAVKKARAMAKADEGELHVGYSPTPVARMLPKVLRACQRAMPKVHIKLHDLANHENIARLRDGRLQLAFVVRPPKAGVLHGLRYEELMRQQICLALPLQHPFARRRTVSLADAAGEPFIGLTCEDYPDYHDFLSLIFGPIKRKPRIVEEYESMAGIVSSLEAGTGVAIVSEAFGYSFGNRVKLLRLTPEPKPISIGIVACKGRLSPVAEKFWQCAKEAVAVK